MFYLTSGTKTTYDKHIVASNRTWSVKCQYYNNGSWASILTSNIKGFQLSDYSTDGSNITMGTVVGGKLSLNLLKITKSVTAKLSRGTYIKITLTLNSSASTSSTTITSGVFVIDDVKLSLRRGGAYDVSLTAYDMSYKMTDKYIASANNLSAKEILTEIGNKYGFTVGQSVDTVISEFENASGTQLETSNVLEGGYLGTTGKWMDDKGETFTKNTGLIEVQQGYTYEYYGMGFDPIASVLWYDSNQNFINAETYMDWSTGATNAIVAPPANAKYAIFQSYSPSDNVVLSVSVLGGTTKYTPIADLTCKQTIGYMAGCYGCYAYFDNDMELQFGWYESNGDTIDANRIFNGNSYVSEMENRTIVMLETGTQSNPIVVPNNAKGFSINYENPYITQAQAQAIYDGKIANGQISFKIGKLSYKGNPLNTPGTIVNVKDVQNESAEFYIMKRTTRYDGGLSETIESQGESETTINYKLTSPTQQKIDRALSRVEEAIKKATDVITQTKGSVFELIPVDESDPSKGNSGWKLYSTEIGSQNVILANSSGIGFSSNGGQSFNAAAIYIDENGQGHINGNFLTAGSVSADKLAAGTITADKISLANLNNLSVINPDNEYYPFMTSGSTVTYGTKDDVKYFAFGKLDKAGYYNIILNKIAGNAVFNKNDTFILRCTMSASTTMKVNFLFKAYYKEGGSANLATVAIKDSENNNIGTSDVTYAIPFTMGTTPTKAVDYYMLMLETDNSAGQVYVRDISVYQSTNGVLLANGAVSADKIAANSITADKIDAKAIQTKHLDTDNLLIGTGNVEGLADELSNIVDTANTASANASTASQNASATALKLGAVTAEQNGVVYVKGSTILAGSIGVNQLAAGSITADKLAANAIVANKITVGNVTNYNQVNANTYNQWDFMDESGVISGFYSPRSFDAGNVPMSDWHTYEWGQTFKVRGYISSNANNGTEYMLAQVTLQLKYTDGTTAICVEPTGAEYVRGSSNYPSTYFSYEIDPTKQNTSKTISQFRVVLRHANSAKPNTGWTRIKDVMVRAVHDDAGTIFSVDRNTYFDLENAEIVAKNNSGYSTKLISGGIKSYYESETAGGLQPYAISGMSSVAKVLWFNHGLRIGKSSPPETESYMDMYDDGVTIYKHLTFYGTSNGFTLTSGGNTAHIYVSGSQLMCNINGTIKTIRLE